MSCDFVLSLMKLGPLVCWRSAESEKVGGCSLRSCSVWLGRTQTAATAQPIGLGPEMGPDLICAAPRRQGRAA